MDLLKLLWDERGATLAITRKTANTLATAAAQNVNAAEIEAVVNGGIDSDNLANDGVTAGKLNSDVVRAGYGLSQHTDGSLQADVSDTNPGLEISDGGIRAKVDDSSIERAAGGLQVKAGGITLAMLATALKDSLYPVGSIYSNATVATNPGTLLGFGTWVAIEGYVIAGYKAGDANFGTPGGTVGAASVTLTAAQSGLPAHSHTFASEAGSNDGTIGSNVRTVSISSGTGSTNAVAAADASAAHTNIQPTLVAYVWKRTA